MTIIYDWIKNIIYYLILISLVFQILPNEQYRKYMKLFTGILLVIIVLKPVRVFMNDESLEKVKAAFYQYNGKEENFSAKMEEFQKQQEKISEEYVAETLKEQIQNIVGNKGYYVQKAELEKQDETEVLCISLIKGDASGKDIIVEAIQIQENQEEVESDEVKEIIKEVADYYQIEESAVEIQLGGQKNG